MVKAKPDEADIVAVYLGAVTPTPPMSTRIA